MADIKYTVSQDSPENIVGFEQYSEEDKNLVSSFQINSVFTPSKHYSEIHILSLSDELIESNYNYSGYRQLGNAQSAGQEGASVLTIDPVEDSKSYGYESGGVKLLYHFLNDLYTVDNSTAEFYIQDISLDRTELTLSTLVISPQDLTTITSAIKNNLASQSYFTGFRLNFKNNDLFIATNIDTLDTAVGKVVTIKLYEPLPTTYRVKSTLNIVDIVSDSVVYEVDAEYILPPVVPPTLRAPNFNIEIQDESVIPTGYYNYDQLFSYPITNANSEIYSVVKEKSIEISVDYTNFSDFVHFSSAEERLLNFKYKVDLISSYSSSISSGSNATTGLRAVSGSKNRYEALITGVVDNFDHYERFLYYESGSGSWPKSNSTKPYINKVSSDSEAITWYANQVENAIYYDNINLSSLAHTVPVFIREDPNNENYLVFIYMIGQHFDNLWVYGKAVTDKYDADSRLDFGISKDLVGEALKNFGVKLYTSNKSIEDLFGTFIGQSYQSGSEVINHYITGSLTGSNTPIQPTSFDDYQKGIQKRIYHNLPLLLKSKGTERGLRALINCYGIPSDILQIKVYGGRNTNERPFFGDYQHYTSSLDKIRLDNTGSIVAGDTLSLYTTIIKEDPKYTDDLHNIEVGFSPTDNVDNYILSQSASTFNIDQYIGDPRDLTSNSYTDLEGVATSILGNLEQYNLQDYVRLIKFFDNTIFKSIKDFIPARALADTGVIIKPNLLNRSKAKSVTTTGTEPENLFTASIDTAFIAGTHGNTFGAISPYDTAYIETIQTPFGLGTTPYHNQQEAKYDGELSGSQITVTNGELTEDNIYIHPSFVESVDNLQYISASIATCNLVTGIESSVLVYESDGPYQLPYFFQGVQTTGVTYTLNPGNTPITFPYTFSESLFNQYDTFTITAVDANIVYPFPPCTATVNCMYGKCDIEKYLVYWDYNKVIEILPDMLPVNLLTTYFTTGSNHSIGNLEVVIIKNLDITVDTLTGIQAQTFSWNDYTFDNSDIVTITLTDTVLLGGCTSSVTITVVDCSIAELLIEPGQGSIGKYSVYFPDESNTIQGGVYARGVSNPIPPAESSPIHHPSYQFSNDSTVYDMRIQFPYLTNPNFIFENSNGTPRVEFPTITAEFATQSKISGYQLGLASFFTGLNNLRDIHYEVFIYTLAENNSTPGVGNLIYSISDGIFADIDQSTFSEPAIKPGRFSPTIVNVEAPVDGLPTERPMWTYTRQAPNSPAGQIVGGQVAELNLEALRQQVNFGERTVFPETQGTLTRPWGYYVKIYAYSPLDPSEPVDTTVCSDVVNIRVESWIKIDSDINNGGGGGIGN